MKYRINIEIPGGTIELEAESQKQVFEELSFWQSLPKTCPVDGSATRLNVRETKEGMYYELVSTGDIAYRGHVGQNRGEGGTLFHTDNWGHWTGAEDIKVRVNGVEQPNGIEKIRKLYEGRFQPAQEKRPQYQQKSTQPAAQHRPAQVAEVTRLASQLEQDPNGNPFEDGSGKPAQTTQPPAGAVGVSQTLTQRIQAVFGLEAPQAEKSLVWRLTSGQKSSVAQLSADECKTLLESLLSVPYHLQLMVSVESLFANDVREDGKFDSAAACRWVIAQWTRVYSKPQRELVNDLSADECARFLASIAEKGAMMRSAYLATLKPATAKESEPA